MITGTKINGIIINGFKTIGKPKIIGSLILKIAGPIDNFPNVFNSADLDFYNKIQSPIVAPPLGAALGCMDFKAAIMVNGLVE